MKQKRTVSRRSALIVGTAVMLTSGVIYAWSIYSSPFSLGLGMTSSQLGMAYTVIFASFCVGGLIGAELTAKLGVLVSMPVGGILGMLGFIQCMFLTKDATALLYLSVCLEGLGSGVVYNAVMSNVVARFPDKRGLATGILLMGFGVSTLIVGGAASSLMESPFFGWHKTYLATGILVVIAACVGGVYLELPGDGDSDVREYFASRDGMTPREMLSTGSFWLLFFTAIAGCAFGSAIIGHARYIALESGAGDGPAALAVGLISVMNGLGRIIFGALHDRRGLGVSFLSYAGIFIAAGAAAALGLAAGYAVMTVAALMLCGLAYGAVPTVLSSAIASRFGRAHYGENISLGNLHILPASFASAIAGAIQTSSGSYSGAIWLFVGLETAAVAAFILLRRGAKAN